MMRMASLAALTAAALVATLPDHAGAQSVRADGPVFGLGATTCEQAMTPDQVARARDWLLGYLTAFGESFGPPAVLLGTPDTVVAMFDETCAAFPKFTLVEAARWVILSLQDRRFNKKR